MKLPARLYPWRSLRGRIALVLVGLTLGLGVIGLVRASLDLTGILRARLENRGAAIAQDLARNSANPAFTDDVFALYELVNSSLVNNEDVRYVFLIESSGDVRVHTFSGGMPPGLKEANPLPRGLNRQVRTIKTSEGSILDVAVSEGDPGEVVRVGMSLEGVQGEVVSYISHLALLGLVAVAMAVALSVFLSSWLTRPLARLAQAAASVGRGELSTKVAVAGGDEVERVARAFNTMTGDLDRAQKELLARNADLEVLNAMGAHLSQLLTTSGAVDAALERLLELTATAGGWICLRNEAGALTIAAHRGMPFPPGDTLGGSSAASRCHCHDVLESGTARVIDGFPRCPLITPPRATIVGRNDGALQHALVPLPAHDEVLGVMVLVSKPGESFDERRLRLLSSLGRQVGIALQNAQLYEAVQRHDQARRRLLEKLIWAQEEERKRVAREVHDEPTQALSGVLMRLDRLEHRLAKTGRYEPGEFEQPRQALRQAIDVLNQITMDLRPRALDDLGLLPAIRSYAAERLGDHDIQLDFKVTGSPVHLDPYAELAVFRVAQEAVSNTIRHARAQRVAMMFAFEGGLLRATIKDNGRGFDTTRIDPGTTNVGLGLLGMEERISLLGGQLSVSSTNGLGTSVMFEVPLREGGRDGANGAENPGAHR